MTRIALIIGLFALAACGVDGAPTAPAARAAPGPTVTGEVLIGVSVGN